jgi:hypothetical protein
VSADTKKSLPSPTAPLPSQKIYQRRSQPSPICRTIANQAPHSALDRHFTICIAATALRLRGLVQHVLSPVATPAISLKLDCLQALGIKRYTLQRTTASRLPFQSPRRVAAVTELGSLDASCLSGCFSSQLALVARVKANSNIW